MACYAIKELRIRCGDDYRILYFIGEGDIQRIARKEFNVNLSKEELERIAHGVEWGFRFNNYMVVVKSVIEEVLKERGVNPQIKKN